MPYWVYVIKSQLDHSYYTGSTPDVGLRVERHNLGWGRSTKAKRPWVLIHTEQYATKTEALRRERQIKRMKSRKYIERLIQSQEHRDSPSDT